MTKYDCAKFRVKSMFLSRFSQGGGTALCTPSWGMIRQKCPETARAKKYRPFLILSNEITHVEGRFISKSERLFLVILQVTDFLNLSGLVVTVDIQKAFNSVNHLFLITALTKFGFGETFIKWLQILSIN